MPCTLPLGLDSGVFMSACASIQIKPSFAAELAEMRATCPRRSRSPPNDRRPAPAEPSMRPPPSPPGPPAARRCARSAEDSARVRTDGQGLRLIDERRCPGPRPHSRATRASRSTPRARSAEGPISTPRRPAPRSMGAPMMAMWDWRMTAGTNAFSLSRYRRDCRHNKIYTHDFSKGSPFEWRRTALGPSAWLP